MSSPGRRAVRIAGIVSPTRRRVVSAGIVTSSYRRLRLLLHLQLDLLGLLLLLLLEELGHLLLVHGLVLQVGLLQLDHLVDEVLPGNILAGEGPPLACKGEGREMEETKKTIKYLTS